MDEVTIEKNRKEQWKQLLTECQSSGMNVDDWCELNNVFGNTYYYWLHHLRKDFYESLPEIKDFFEETTTFKRLETEPPIPNTQAAVIMRLSAFDFLFSSFVYFSLIKFNNCCWNNITPHIHKMLLKSYIFHFPIDIMSNLANMFSKL